MSVTKTHAPAVFVAGGTGSFIIQPQNSGPAGVLGAFSVSDTLDPRFTLVDPQHGGSGSGWTCSVDGNLVVCNTDTIDINTVLNPITIPVTVALTAQGTIQNTANFSVSIPSGETTINATPANDFVSISPPLSVTKTHVPVAGFPAGGTGTFLIQAQNTSPVTLAGVFQITDFLNPVFSVPNGQFDAGNGWTCLLGNGLLNCTLGSFSAPPNGLLPLLTLPVGVALTASGTITNTATVDLEQLGAFSAPGSTGVAILSPISVTKTHFPPAGFTAGGPGTFTIQVANTISQPLTGTFSVTDVLNPAFTPLSASGTGWQCVTLGPSVTCTTPPTASIPAGGALPPITILVSVGITATGVIPNTANAQAQISDGEITLPFSATFTDQVVVLPPSPILTSLSPPSATAGAPAFAITVNGSQFRPGAVVRWNNTSLSTTFVNSNQVTALVPANLVAVAGSASVSVTNGGVPSNSLPFTIVPAPTLTLLSPSTGTAGGPAFVLTVNGTGFVSGAIVQWNNTALLTVFETANQMTASVPANLIAAVGSASVSVTTGGVKSNSLPFTIVAAPTLTQLNPSTATAGGPAFVLTLTGTGFVSGSVVHWNNTSLTTVFANAGQLTASVPANLIAVAGSASVVVANGSVLSNSLPFTITVLPTITTLSPSTVTASAPAFVLTVNGTGFASGAVVQLNSTPLSTTFVNGTQLTATVPAGLIATAGTAQITVSLGGVTSNSVPLTIATAQTITMLSPSTVTAGAPAFVLTVNGTGFASGAVVQLNSTPLSTTFVNGTQLTATVPAGLIATTGTAQITVSLGGVTSNSVPLTIATAQTITTLSPGTVPVGGPAFILTINGTGFVSGSVVQLNGTPLSTTFENGTQLTAAVPADLTTTAGTAPITVSFGGVTSNSVPLTIATAPTITLLNPSTVIAGGPAFILTVSGTGFSPEVVVQWDTTPLATTFVNANQITASVPANLIASAGSATITVVFHGVTSNGETISIVPPISAPSLVFSQTPGLMAGQFAFSLTVTVPPQTDVFLGTLALGFNPDPQVENLPVGTPYADPNLRFLQTGNLPTQLLIQTAPCAGAPNSTPCTSPVAPVGDAALLVQNGNVAGTDVFTLAKISYPFDAANNSVGQDVTAAICAQINCTLFEQTIPVTPPVITGTVSIQNVTSTGFDVIVSDAVASTRRVDSATLLFAAASGFLLNGTSRFTATVPIDSQSYFSTPTTLPNVGITSPVLPGGEFGVTIHFPYTGDTKAIGSVTVTLSNAIGNSNSVTGTLQ